MFSLRRVFPSGEWIRRHTERDSTANRFSSRPTAFIELADSGGARPSHQTETKSALPVHLHIHMEDDDAYNGSSSVGDDQVDIQLQPDVPTSSAVLAAPTAAVDASPPTAAEEVIPGLSIFERYLSLWVALCMLVGTLIGIFAPSVNEGLAKATVAEVSLPVAVLVWLMIFPMSLRIDFASLKDIAKHPRSLLITVICNWAFQPFLMFGLAELFFRAAYTDVLSEDKQKQYIAGSVILGGSPCTAMVFVWSTLVHGHAAYTLIQVAINDLLVMVLYVPTLYLLLDLSGVNIPYLTIVLSIIIFVVVPFGLGALLRWWLLRNRTPEQGDRRISKVEALFHPLVMFGLLAVVVLTFIFQGKTIESKWPHILLIAVPLTLQTYISFGVAYSLCYVFSVEWRIAAPAAFISSSNFFELAIAVALSAYGIDSGATLATTVGVLTEVPVMLSLVYITKATKYIFERRDAAHAAIAAKAASNSPSTTAREQV